MTGTIKAALLLVSSAPTWASYLYVTSYSGTLTTLDLANTGLRERSGHVPSLSAVATTQGCAGSPSWATLDHPNEVLYCIDEGLTTVPYGSLSSYKTNTDGSLTQLDKVTTPAGPVYAVQYGKHGHGLALPHYAGSALTTWDISNPSSIQNVQTDNFTLSGPGPDPSRQDAPHPHEAILDPTGGYVLVPDLGADLIRVFAVDRLTGDLKLTALDPLKIDPGSGPRHASFAVSGDKTYLYLVTELSNSLFGFEVTYGEGSIHFAQFWKTSTHGLGEEPPSGAAAAEVHVSPDGKFLVVSSRYELAFQIDAFNGSGTKVTSDTLINFSIDGNTGELQRLQSVPCGGRTPRQFSINEAGTKVAVGEQDDGRVVIIDRDPVSGLLGDFAAYADVVGQVTCVVFDE